MLVPSYLPPATGSGEALSVCHAKFGLEGRSGYRTPKVEIW